MGQIEALTGVELKVLRIRKGLRQYDVAARLGIPPGRLSEIESGRREPSPELLGRILGVLGEGELPLPVDFPRERAQEP